MLDTESKRLALWPQRRFKWRDEWSKEVNSMVDWEIQQGNWDFEKR
jgi:hypothetical protein